jgi:septal ring factor EnvC (AmiA/AmiB activator)
VSEVSTETKSYLREWAQPSTIMHLITVVACVILAWGNVTNRLESAEKKIIDHDTRIDLVEKQVTTTEMNAERANTNLERRLAEIPVIKTELQEMNRKIERLINQGQQAQGTRQ